MGNYTASQVYLAEATENLKQLKTKEVRGYLRDNQWFQDTNELIVDN